MEETLRLTSILDSQKYRMLDKEAKPLFFKSHAEEILSALIRIPDEADDNSMEYHVNAEYILMDSYYNKHGKVKVTIIYSKREGATIVNIKEVKD